MTGKNIGLVLSFAPGYSETFFSNKIKGLKKKGHIVTLFVDYKPKQAYNLDCEMVISPDISKGVVNKLFVAFKAILSCILRSPKRSIKLFKLNRELGLVFKKNIENLILNHKFLEHNLDYLHFGFGMLAVGRENVAEAMDAKMAVSFRGYDLYLSPLKHPNCYDILFKTDVKYHVLSMGMRNTLIEYGIDQNKIHIISPAINMDFFKRDGKNKNADYIRFLTIARLHWKKGIEYTLEALAMLKSHNISFTYRIIGDGDQYERLVFAAHQLGLSQHIKFMGKLSPEDVKKELENTDIYLQYSIQEGFCNAVIEAQAMGNLCIVSNAEGLDENIIDGQTGWVVAKRQPKLLVKKILEVIGMEDGVKDKMKNSSSNRARKIFNIKEQEKKFNAFYQD